MTFKKMHPPTPSRARRTCEDIDGVPDKANSFHATAWMLVGAAMFAMLFPVVLLRGMSLDGVTYATIARNMAVGLGDFWHPFYTATLLHPYYESPTLAFLIQSWFFCVLGDQWWVERLYSVLTVVPTAALIVLIWRRLLRHDPRLVRYGWLPLALWIVMPSWFWIYRHNYLENTLGIFTALAVYASLRAMENTPWWSAWTLLAAAGITAAFLSKGPVGMFPAITPAIAWLALRQQSLGKGLVVQLMLIVFLAAAFCLVIAQPDAREFLSAYFDRQVVASLQGQRDSVDSPLGRFQLAWDLPVDLIVSAGVAAALAIWTRALRVNTRTHDFRGPIALAFMTGLSASVPIMLSPKQSAYYAAASWPFYTMSLALWCLPAVSSLSVRWSAATAFDRSARGLRGAALGVTVLTIVVALRWQGTIFRDAELIHDVERIGQFVGSHGRIQIDPEMQDEWSLQAYLYRRHYISLALGEGHSAYRLELADCPSRTGEGYELAEAGLSLLRLYKRAGVATVKNTAGQAR